MNNYLPQIQQGLLGDQNQQLENLIRNSADAAAQLAQYANQTGGSNLAAQRMAATQQQAQQMLAQQKQSQSGIGSLLGKIAALYTGGGLLNRLRRR